MTRHPRPQYYLLGQRHLGVCQPWIIGMEWTAFWPLFLQVHINLGVGESELSSSPGIRLDDLEWHVVTISRKKDNLTMTVDNEPKYTTK